MVMSIVLSLCTLSYIIPILVLFITNTFIHLLIKSHKHMSSKIDGLPEAARGDLYLETMKVTKERIKDALSSV